jgi:hypothetical protein
VVLGVTTISIGSYAFIIIGMPCGRQYQDGTLPGPPAAMSATFASKTFWYSGVSGAFWPACTHRGMPTRFHCPARSGNSESARATALQVVAQKTSMPIALNELRLSITVLPVEPLLKQMLICRRHTRKGQSGNRWPACHALGVGPGTKRELWRTTFPGVGAFPRECRPQLGDRACGRIRGSLDLRKQ